MTTALRVLGPEIRLYGLAAYALSRHFLAAALDDARSTLDRRRGRLALRVLAGDPVRYARRAARLVGDGPGRAQARAARPLRLAGHAARRDRLRQPVDPARAGGPARLVQLADDRDAGARRRARAARARVARAHRAAAAVQARAAQAAQLRLCRARAHHLPGDRAVGLAGAAFLPRAGARLSPAPGARADAGGGGDAARLPAAHRGAAQPQARRFAVGERRRLPLHRRRVRGERAGGERLVARAVLRHSARPVARLRVRRHAAADDGDQRREARRGPVRQRHGQHPARGGGGDRGVAAPARPAVARRAASRSHPRSARPAAARGGAGGADPGRDDAGADAAGSPQRRGRALRARTRDPGRGDDADDDRHVRRARAARRRHDGSAGNLAATHLSAAHRARAALRGNAMADDEQDDDKKGGADADADGGDGDGKGDDKAEEDRRKDEEHPAKAWWPWFVGGAVVLVFVVVVLLLIFWPRSRVKTDDAYVTAHYAMVAPRVSGQVARVLVEDNQAVRRGQLLVEIDPADYRAALDQALAALAQDRAQTDQARAQVSRQPALIDQANAQVAAADAALDLSRANAARYANLAATGAGSQQQRQQYQAQLRQDEAQRKQAQANLVAARRQLDALDADTASARAKVDADEAAVRQARLNLGYTRIVAPIDGTVDQRSVQVGNYTAPGAAMMTLVPLHDVYIEANYRELALRHMAPGQHVRVHVDSYDIWLDGFVQSLPPSSGAAYSPIPPNNATATSPRSSSVCR
ncbi:hypothetical protein SLE2022_405980 [Rubroshorea leprosula]